MACNFGLPQNGAFLDFIDCSSSNPYEDFQDCFSQWNTECSWLFGYNGDEDGGGYSPPIDDEIVDSGPAFDETEEFFEEYGIDDPFVDPMGDDPFIDDSLEFYDDNTEDETQTNGLQLVPLVLGFFLFKGLF